ncbi:MAG: hypothetical protein ACJAS4_000543 [Bacteriovoracaceae bacterium]|jgi:hypothetical protein
MCYLRFIFKILKEFVMKTMNKKLLCILGVTLSFQSVMADTDLSQYPDVYPFVPQSVEEIYTDVATVTEDKDFIKNFNDIVNENMSKAQTKVKPWSASYWPLSKGTVADPYSDNVVGYYVDAGWLVWKNNYKDLKERRSTVHKEIDSLSEKELALLSPTEKYDVLLGDKTFDLTRRVSEYMNDWGSKKMNAFITDLRLVDENALDLANKYVSWGWYKTADEAFEKDYELQGSLSVENALSLVKIGSYNNVTEAFSEAVEMAKAQEGNYVLAKQSSFMAGWEGICNGWSTAAGNIPRPRKAISFKLPNGKNLKFYPSDIRGLASLYWVNSFIQNTLVNDENGNYQSGGTISAGNRCNTDAKEDEWGRLYDSEDDPFNGRNYKTGKRDARCSGVHPAKWHLGIVNLIGKQGRSFIVERKVGPAVDNHPMHSYEMKYFNPVTGEEDGSISSKIVRIDSNDQFRQMRNPNARYIVGVETTMTYLNYLVPSRENKTSEEDDKDVDKTMMYDLELDGNYDIVGGQWRAVKIGKPRRVKRPGSKIRKKEKRNHNQPDFFWAVTKNWKETGLFDDNTGLEEWKDKTTAPPASYADNAKGAHALTIFQKYSYNAGQKCNMVDQKTGKLRAVSCEKEINRPQPQSNVLNVLIERAK